LPFLRDYLIHQQWPVGPPWFIWLLLGFNILAALLPEKLYTGMAAFTIKLIQRPRSFFLFWLSVVALSLIPLSIWIGQYTWTGFGPFDFQLNRVLYYFVFFLFGTVLGSFRWQEYLFRNNRLLNQSSPTWIISGLLCFAVVEVISFWGYRLMPANLVNKVTANVVFMLFFITTTITVCFAFMIIFRNYRNHSSGIWKKMSKNAYGIYLFHYVFITWLQFVLLDIKIPALIKFIIVFSGTLAASFALVETLKKIRAVSSII
jgi:glucan biosynthesis protein C